MADHRKEMIINMNELIKSIEDEQLKEVADFNVGDTVKVYGKIKEGNRERIQIFEGVVLKTGNRRQRNFHCKEILQRGWRGKDLAGLLSQR